MNCPTCFQEIPEEIQEMARVPILEAGKFVWDGKRWVVDGWSFANLSHIGGWTLEELAQIARTKDEITSI